MIINQNEKNINFPKENKTKDLKQGKNSFSKLILNPKKYREYKLNINRTNNIDNEIIFLKTKDKFKKINFSKIIIIDYEEYKSSIKETKKLNDLISNEEILDIISHKKLLSFEKNLLEIYSYLLGQEFFDWKNFRENFNLYEAKKKMSNVNYSQLEINKINMLLNKISRSGKIKNFFNNKKLIYPSLEIIYEWVRCQIKIYFYLIQNNLIPNKIIESKKNDEKKNIINNNINDNNLNLTLTNYKSRQNEDKNNLNESDYFNEKRNLTLSNFRTKNHKNNFLITIPNYNTTDYTNNYYNNTENLETISSNDFYNDEYISNEGNINYNNDNDFINYENENYYNKNIIKNKIVQLDFNKPLEKENKEEKVVENLPLLKYRTFHQMKYYYNMFPKYNKKIEKRNLDFVNSNSKLNHHENNKYNLRILSMIGNKKIGVLRNVPLFKIKKIIENYE